MADPRGFASDNQSCEDSGLLAQLNDDMAETITLRIDVFCWDTGYCIATVRAESNIAVCRGLKAVNQDEPDDMGENLDTVGVNPLNRRDEAQRQVRTEWKNA